MYKRPERETGEIQAFSKRMNSRNSVYHVKEKNEMNAVGAQRLSVSK